jgi:hypothetical protein
MKELYKEMTKGVEPLVQITEDEKTVPDDVNLKEIVNLNMCELNEQIGEVSHALGLGLGKIAEAITKLAEVHESHTQTSFQNGQLGHEICMGIRHGLFAPDSLDAPCIEQVLSKMIEEFKGEL